MKQLLIGLFLSIASHAAAQSTTLLQLNRMHQVQKGETVEQIATHYGISVQELLQANQDVKLRKGSYKKGTLIAIPESKTEITIEEAPVDTPQVRSTYPSLKVGVVLPLEEKDNLQPRMVEFYQGLLLAANTVKKEGTDLDILTLSSGTTATQMQTLLNGGKLADRDIIFGPVHTQQIPALADYCRLKNTRLVLPFSNNYDISTHPTVFSATAPNDTLSLEAARLLVATHPDGHYVILRSGEEDAKGRQFTQAIMAQTGATGLQPIDLNLNGDGFAYEFALNQFMPNIIIPDNTSLKVLNILLARLNDFKLTHSQYQLSLVGYPEWQTYTNKVLPSLYKYDTSIYSSYYLNPVSERTWEFQNLFSHTFGTPLKVSFPRYGTLGYDLGYHFLHGLATTGDTFTARMNQLPAQAYQNSYQFYPVTEGGGYINRFVELIHYTTDEKIEIIR